MDVNELVKEAEGEKKMVDSPKNTFRGCKSRLFLVKYFTMSL